MNCKNCGYPLFSNDKFCKNCGLEVVTESDIPAVVNENKVDNGPITPVINNGPIVDPTKPNLDNITPVNTQEQEFSYDNQEEVKEVAMPAVNNGPIAPVIGEGNGMSLPDIDAKKIEPPAVNYDKIDGPRGVSNVMSMMGAPKEEEAPKVEPIPDFNAPQEVTAVPTQEGPQLANVNQGLPAIPKDKKETKSSVIIPTKPKPTNSEPVNNNQGYNNNYNNQNMNQNYNNQPMNNNYDVNNQYNNQFNNQYNMQQQEVVQEKKKGNPILIIIILIILGVGGYFAYKYLIKDAGKVPTKDVSFSGYQFKVPEAYKTKVNANTLVAYDDNIKASINLINGSYSDISTAVVLENFTAAGSTASYMGEKEKNGNKYHLFKVEVDSKKAYIGYTASGVTKIVCFSIETKTGTTYPSDDDLNKTVDIAMSPTYNGSSNIDVSDVDQDSIVVEASKALTGEDNSTGDVYDEDVYEDIYVNITLEEINE